VLAKSAPALVQDRAPTPALGFLAERGGADDSGLPHGLRQLRPATLVKRPVPGERSDPVNALGTPTAQH
jgi:hypothetical protein